MDEVDAGMFISKVEDKNLKISEDLGLDDKPAKKARIDSSCKLPVKHKDGPSMLKKDESSKISLNQDSLLVKDLGADLGAKTMEIEAPGVLQESVPLSKKNLSHPQSDSRMDEIDAGIPICSGEGKNLKISDDLGLDDKPSKKARIYSSVKLPVKQSILQKEEKAVENDMLQVPGTVVCDDDGKQSKHLKDLPRPDKGSFKKVKPDEKASKKSNSTVAKTKAVNAAEENVISEGQVTDVTRKPDRDWDESIKGPHEKGTLILENLDPTYSSSEIEVIIWSGFRVSCIAKVVPQTAISSLHSERTVSASHYSQSNTIEYDMAMEWCRLQKSFEKTWKNLYKEQGESLQKLKAKRKSKTDLARNTYSNPSTLTFLFHYGSIFVWFCCDTLPRYRLLK